MNPGAFSIPDQMIYLLDPDNPNAPFPPVEHAEKEPDGLLAVGGDLSAQRLLNAYRHGIFPWYSDQQPILWWSPDPRTVLYPDKIKISRSLKKALRNKPFTVTFDSCFARIIQACAKPRNDSPGIWITEEMQEAYTQLHNQGFAHSVEVWLDDRLVGGLYGIAIGEVFFGESMFSRVADASKIALVKLCQLLTQRGYRMIDCQVYTEHLISLGAEEISRKAFIRHLDEWCITPVAPEPWQVRND